MVLHTAPQNVIFEMEVCLRQFVPYSTVEQVETPHIPVSTILEKGGLFRSVTIKYWWMEPKQCHDNVAYLFQRHKIKHMCVGYALAPDGQWRYHSWGFGHNQEIVETTAPFLLYFGCVLVIKE